MNKQNVIHKFGSIGALFGVLKLSSLCKLSFLLGSRAIFFSASSCVMPALGRYRSLVDTAILGLFTCMLHAVFFGFSLASSVLWVPGVFAAWYWKIESCWYRVGLPLICIAAFLMHSTGSAAAPYALYWLIPCMIAYVPKKTVLLDAYASTFIAHAVGSVIWLYTVPMNAEQWLALIPLVMAERTVYAFGITGMIAIASMFSSYKNSVRKVAIVQLSGNKLLTN